MNDLTDYKNAIAKTHESLKIDVKKMGPGGLGRDLEGLEALKVQVANPEKLGQEQGQGQGRAATTTTTTRLGDLAQVVPRGGKTVAVLVGDKDVRLPQPVNYVLAIQLPNPPPTHILHLWEKQQS